LTCFVKEGYSFIVARAWKSFGGIDTNAELTLANAEKAGMTDNGVYMFPCLNAAKTPLSQVQ
jgi:hypothetical protein